MFIATTKEIVTWYVIKTMVLVKQCNEDMNNICQNIYLTHETY